MMKKFMAVLLALALLCGVAAAETYTAGHYYTIDYPDALSLDDSSYTDDNTDTSTWLFMLLGDDYLIDASVSTVEEYAGFSLQGADETQKQDYINEVMSTFADQTPALADTFTAADGVPFYVFSMEDSDGQYYYAETIISGESMNFCCYYYDASTAPDAALLSALKTVLSTYRAAGASI